MKEESCRQSLKVLCHLWPLQGRTVNFLEEVASALAERGYLVTKKELPYRGLQELASGVPRSDYQLASQYEVVITEATKAEALHLLKKVFPKSAHLLILDDFAQGMRLRDTFNDLRINIFYRRPGPGALARKELMEQEVAKLIGEVENLLAGKSQNTLRHDVPALT